MPTDPDIYLSMMRSAWQEARLQSAAAAAMSAPFDTLQLARGFGADLATKRDLNDLGKDLKLWLGTLMVVVATLLFAALHYIPPTGHG